MALEIELIGPNDKPALLAISAQDALEFVKGTLANLGYKVHTAGNHQDFMTRFGQINYEVVVIEEFFDCNRITDNASLAWLKQLPMARRRHATLFLIGMPFQTMNVMQAYQQSVHAVINPQEYASLPQILQKGISDNLLFLSTFREVQKQLTVGKH